ncbi:unnamed protein product [Cylindrotheca closterium]|uniref:PABS domain-containing protein n=1 Tax=Cylindrotheca closterium TaxID=2856 RepID=A0AAD2FHQ0_9STRA|nr:unnamed protein product [Cylindrotheca closterium]
MMRILSFVVLSLVQIWAHAYSSERNAEAYLIDIVEWVSSHKDGFVNQKAELRLLNLDDDDDDNEPLLGIFAKAEIAKDEVITQIPWEMIVKGGARSLLLGDSSSSSSSSSSSFCNLVQTLANELKLGKRSKYAPYVLHLRSLRNGQIPSAWSVEGKYLLTQILGGDDQQLPPGSITQILEEEWYAACGGDRTDAVMTKAAELVIQREDQGFMVPLYDLVEHRNGHHTNTKTRVKEGIYHQTVASRTIKAGEQLYKSHDLCEGCNEEAIEQGYGTAGEPSQGQEEGVIQVTWHPSIKFDPIGKSYVQRRFRKELRRMFRVKNTLLKSKRELIPKHEWDAIWQYYDTIKTALLLAMHSLIDPKSDIMNTCSRTDQSMNQGDVCNSDLLELYEVHYHDLEWEVDDTDYIEPRCTKSQIIELEDYALIDESKTNYQPISFWERKSDGDICMNLETTLQICSTYRPHYHEFFVHFPARYIDKIKRVIFIGGGDAMLLHEVLKFPELEKVVGLELDQQVTRKSFNYFKSQPHWDEQRVEWWYGDATKSLPLLPQGYWGSFDLVLVDLSETVMSMSVTGELDIFSALALLLKPEGIMVKNEPYIDQFSNFFDHTIHIFYGTPKICTQVLVMGSNKVDFLDHPIKEHPEIERLLLEQLDDPADRFKYFHDYRKNNATEQGKCTLREGSVTTQQGKKAGILEILEVENASISSKQDLESAIYIVASDVGLVPVSSPSDTDGAIVAVMKEGYIIARIWAEQKYCALDIHLWGAFEKSSALRSALMEAVGSDTVSSYRIVVGGMFGSNTSESDNNAIGIQVSQQRNCEAEVLNDDENTGEDETMVIALLQTVDLLVAEKSNLKAVVLCGFKDEGKCWSVDVLAANDRAKTVLPIWACDTLKNSTEDPSVYPMMYECEKEVEDYLMRLTQGNNKIDMVILDQSAPRQMAQIFASIMSYTENPNNFTSEEHVFVSLIRDLDSELWRREFLEQYRRGKHDLPLFRTEISMKAADRNLGLHFVLCSKNGFGKIHELKAMLSKHASGYLVGIERVTGGSNYYDEAYNMVEFPDSAYDREAVREKGRNSVAYGRQSIFQFEKFSSNEGGMPPFDDLKSMFLASLTEMDYNTNWEQGYSDVGDGAVFVSKFEEGLAVLVWDGQKHVDVNLFSTDQSEERANGFRQSFITLSGLSQYLRDDQPRGTGGLMLFDFEIPHHH